MEDLPPAMSMDEEVEDEFSFNVPTNFSPPEGYEEGKPFEMVASLTMENGRLKINSLNGAKLAAEEDEVEDETGEAEAEVAEEAPMAPDGGESLMKALGTLG
jgi:hypothetical protein